MDHEDGEDKGEEEKGNGKRRRVLLLCWTLIQQNFGNKVSILMSESILLFQVEQYSQ